MRLSKICRQLLDVAPLIADDVEFFGTDLIFHVRPRWRKPRCGGCGRKCSGYDRRDLRYWRHMAMGAAVVWLAYAPVRVPCPDCGVCTEQVPWARHRSRFTLGLEELVAHLAQQMDKTAITRLLGISGRKERYTNAIVEGMNNRIRMIARRAYGFHSAEALQSMIFLCLGGIKLNPPLPTH